MRLLTRLAILFYMTVLSILCGILILLVTHVIDIRGLTEYLGLAYNDPRLRSLLGFGSAAVIFFSFMSTRIIFAGHQKERTIAFDNPAGRVSVSLAALEDMVRRLVLKVSDVKEVRTGIIATKKGLEVETRLILKSDVNIPELTGHLQEMVKNRIQDSIGIEESVVVKIHVVKITTDDIKAKKNKGDDEERSEPTIPFRGYRA